MEHDPCFSLLLPFFPSAETFQIMKQTRAHEGSVFTMCVLQGGALLSGGGKDRKIIRWSADLAPERECEVRRSLYNCLYKNVVVVYTVGLSFGFLNCRALY